MVDNAETRKNRLCAHRVFGSPFTSNAVHLGFLSTFEKLKELLPSDEACDIYTQSMAQFFKGTGIEMWVAQKKDCPTQAEYIHFNVMKNYGFFDFLCRMLVSDCSWEEIILNF